MKRGLANLLGVTLSAFLLTGTAIAGSKFEGEIVSKNFVSDAYPTKFIGVHIDKLDIAVQSSESEKKSCVFYGDDASKYNKIYSEGDLINICFSWEAGCYICRE